MCERVQFNLKLLQCGMDLSNEKIMSSLPTVIFCRHLLLLLYLLFLYISVIGAAGCWNWIESVFLWTSEDKICKWSSQLSFLCQLSLKSCFIECKNRYTKKCTHKKYPERKNMFFLPFFFLFHLKLHWQTDSSPCFPLSLSLSWIINMFNSNKIKIKREKGNLGQMHF